MKQARIAIDMRMMKPFPTGIGSHFLQLMHAYISRYPDNEYIFIYEKAAEGYIKKIFTDCLICYCCVNIPGGTVKQYVSSFALHQTYKKLDYDILITDPWCFFPGIPGKYILMMYDLIGFHDIVPVSLKQHLFDTFVYKFAIEKAQKVIASTEFVKKDVITLFKKSEQAISVVMPSASPEYQQYLPDEYSQSVLQKYHLSGRYIVYIGNRRKHKNISGALEIFNEVAKKHPEILFILIGAFDSNHGKRQEDINTYVSIHFPTIIDRVIELGRITNNYEVKAILSHALCLLHPTLFEGYGLTPLEAMFSGSPVVASAIEPIQEVVKDAGILLPPEDTSQFVQAIEQLITQPDLGERYKQKGLRRSQIISWDKAAYKINSVITSCLESTRGI